MCTGEGYCLEQCCCECSEFSECTCGHSEHRGYCKPIIPCSYNCEPKLCPNDKNHHKEDKGLLYPEWLFYCHGGNCLNCGMIYGHGFKNTNEIKECSVCYENKPMISLRCNHELCWDCWSNICKKEEYCKQTSCPFCRRKKW